jgi:hypothetical protein
MGLLSCGLEAFYYIDYIPQGEYYDTNTIINLPSSGTEGYTYFDNFIIFYRIYISANIVQTGRQLEGTGTNNGRTAINSTLNSDYNGLYSLTDITSTSVNTSDLERTFSNRRYFTLTLQDANINAVLGSSSLGQRLEIFFDTRNGEQPTLRINSASYNLQRAIKNENLALDNLNPLPNRNFLNHPELYSTVNVTNGRNADVASGSGTPRYTYVSMYIAAKGTSLEMPPSPIYSQPTFIGIFQLSEWS